jgi:RecA/RadA recombinase
MSQALRKLTGTISKTNCTVIFINQLREKIGVMFGNPETTTGGNALKFYASVRLDIRRRTQIKDGDRVIGNSTKVKVVKNKVAPPFQIAEFDIMYGKGISIVGEVLDIGVELGIIKKSGSWFSYGETKLGQGRDAVKGLIKDNPELMAELEGKIKSSDGNVLGNKTRVKVVKNKVAPPFKLAEFDIMYGEGISKVGEILDIAVENEIVKKSGSWFSYQDSKLGQGRDAVKNMLKDNPDLMDELEEKIKVIISENK